MKYTTLALSALAALTAFAGVQARADNMASIAIAPATGVVTLTPHWSIGSGLTGFHLMTQNTGFSVGANNWYSVKSETIPAGGDTTAFSYYIAGSGAATNIADVGSKLSPNSYSALTSADPDLGYGAVNLYFIHHKASGDYFTAIIPGSGTSSAITDEKPMSGPGGPATLGASGYFGLTFAATNLNYGVNLFYYLRTDSATGNTWFGSLTPALLSGSTDLFNLGSGGHNALDFTDTDVGYGVSKMYFLRLDPITGFSILGTLNPGTGLAADIANLGSVYSTLDFVVGNVGFGTNQFYTTGSVNTTWQSVSFAAITSPRAIIAGAFPVTPSASSGLPITLTMVPGSVGAVSISGPTAGVFTITPTAPGLVTLQATQVGQLSGPAYEYNMLRQSFTVTGTSTLAITTQPTSQTAVTGTTATFSVAASGSTTLSYQWQKAGANITGNASATTATLTLANVQAADGANYDVVVSDLSGSIPSNTVVLTVTTAAPVVTNSPLTAAGTVGTPFTFTIAASGSPTSYGATPLPAGLTIATATGVISGTPTAPGSTGVLLSATNATSTGYATLNVTVAAAGVAPIITNSPLTAAGTVGTSFTFTITASGSPTSYTATPLPAGLTIATATGVISGTPTAVSTTNVVLGATNATGTGNATLTITVGAAGVAPTITNNPLTAAGTVGTPFSFTITATGSPASYSASPLPAGLSIVATTGAITGTPTSAATTSVLLGATNGFGTGQATLSITVAAAGSAPVITNSPLSAGATVGTPFSFTITATGSPASYTASPLPAGLSIVAATGAITGTPTAAATTAVTLGATSGSGTGNATLTITVAAAGSAPVINNSPLTATGSVGTPFSFTITASGSPASYAASPLPAGLSIVTTTGVITGTPTASGGPTSVTLGATNSSGTGTATLAITIAAQPTSRISNFSARAISGPGSASLIMGFVVAGNGENLLVRGIGPTLAEFGIANFLPDPFLTIYSSAGAVLATNQTWGTNSSGVSQAATITAMDAEVGAFTLPSGSLDSALLVTLNSGAGTTGLVTPFTTTGGTGVALVEMYDTGSASGTHLINVSARMNVTAGDGVLIAGLAIAGNTTETVLIRGVGPTLAEFGVTGVLADPVITVYSGSTVIASNAGWGTGITTAGQISSVSAQVGAFPLPSGSKDSALLLTLQPGSYTVVVTSASSSTGVALIEVYDTQ